MKRDPELTWLGAQNEASFISVAATSETARKLIYSSPMDVQFVDEPFDGLSQGTSLFSSSQPGVAPQINPIVNPNITSSIDNKYGNKATHFTVHVFPNEGYRHKTVIRYSPLYGPWPKEDAAKETFVYAALDKVVPKNIMAREAFCDWRTGGQLSDDARNMRNQSQNGKLAYIQERKMRRKKSIAATAGEPIILTELKSLRQPKADMTPAADKKEDE